jgi:hypothetical protein
VNSSDFLTELRRRGVLPIAGACIAIACYHRVRCQTLSPGIRYQKPEIPDCEPNLFIKIT